MANGKTRPRRYYLTRLVEGRGDVYFVTVPDRRHRAIGWYFDPRSNHAGCECEFCDAAHAGAPAFVGGNAWLAAALLHDYVETHPPPAEARSSAA